MGIGSRITFWTCTWLLILIHVTWFTVEVAISSLQPTPLVTNGNTNDLSPLTDAVNVTNNEYIVRQIFMCGALIASWFSERYPLSRAAALASFAVTTTLTFSWLAMNLPYTYSIFNLSGPGYRTEFCTSKLDNAYCQATFAVGVLSVLHVLGIFFLWLLSLYQNARAEAAPHLKYAERMSIGLIYISLLGAVVWSAGSIILNTDSNFSSFSSYALSRNYFNGYQWGGLAFSLASAAWVAFGATRGAKWVALLANSFFFANMFPSFVYDARASQQCPPRYAISSVTSWHCDSVMAVAAGEGIVTAASFLLMITMLVLYLTTDAADFMPDKRSNGGTYSSTANDGVTDYTNGHKYSSQVNAPETTPLRGGNDDDNLGVTVQ